MVEDRITDGKRIGQLLASELTGLATGPLADLAVVDADRDAQPSEDGTVAYRLAYRGERVATVSLYPDHAQVAFRTGAPSGRGKAGPGDGPTLRVESGAQVKRAADAIRGELGEGAGGKQ